MTKMENQPPTTTPQTPPSSQSPVLLYDGICGICNTAVQTVLRLDPDGALRFAALDSEFARSVIARHPELADVDSVVFVEQPGQPGERVSIRSAAALQVADYLGGPWRALRAVGVIPAPIRDRVYDGFARIRYRVFGTKDTCPIPAPEVRARFVDV